MLYETAIYSIAKNCCHSRAVSNVHVKQRYREPSGK